MEEIKLWKIVCAEKEKPKAMSIGTVAAITTERLLEDLLAGSPDLLMPNLRLLGRQTETPGGPLDLLGVDEDGQLVVFELKRGNLTRDAVAQAIDYASYLADLEPEKLCNEINLHSGKGGIDSIKDFGQWYQSEFQRPVEEIGRPRIVLVGLGVEERAKRMVEFLSQCELDISLITFQGFAQGSEILLARNVEVQSRPSAASGRSTKLGNRTKLEALLDQLNVKAHYEEFTDAIKQGLGAATYQWPNPTGYSFYLPETAPSGGPTNRAYVALYCPEEKKGSVQILLQPRAVDAAGKDRVEQLAKAMGSQLVIKPGGYGEVWIDGHKSTSTYIPHLAALGEAIASGWKIKAESHAKNESEPVGIDI